MFATLRFTKIYAVSPSALTQVDSPHVPFISHPPSPLLLPIPPYNYHHQHHHNHCSLPSTANNQSTARHHHITPEESPFIFHPYLPTTIITTPSALYVKPPLSPHPNNPDQPRNNRPDPLFPPHRSPNPPFPSKKHKNSYISQHCHVDLSVLNMVDGVLAD